MLCILCHGEGRLLKDVCPLCDGIPGWPEDVKTSSTGPHFRCLSYNVLLPNSFAGKEEQEGITEGQTGWWIYKYYRDHCDATEWPARSALLQSQLLPEMADDRYDVICLQEVNPLSFAEDFAFLTEAGYCSLMHESMKGPMRPATFWRRDMWELVSARNCQRTLVVALRLLANTRSTVFIVNGHLHAGDAVQRLGQADGALEAVSKEARALGLAFPGTPVVFCGDFNSEGHTAVRELLVNGAVTADFREAGSDEAITKKGKKQRIGAFVDAADCFFQGNAPATLLLPKLDSKMLAGEGPLSQRRPTDELVAAVDKAFQLCCSEGRTVMLREDIDRWLIKINGKLGRGAEHFLAMAKFKSHGGEEMLTRDDFLDILMSCLHDGKFWEVNYDLNVIGGLGLAVPSEGPCELRMDYIYFTPASLRLVTVQEPLSREQHARIFSDPWDVLPNAWHPSDHLPVVATFELL